MLTLPVAIFLSFVSLRVSLVNAHAFVTLVRTTGHEYPGWNPWTDPYVDPKPTRVVRNVPGDGPIESITDPSLACNIGGNNGTSMMAEAAAGSNISFQWNTWPADHNGTIAVYMSSCRGDCKTFVANNAKFFKISQAGYHAGRWATLQFIDQKYTWTTEIPPQLEAGDYLIRMEIMALHSSAAAQFYISCTQLRVTGGGKARPSEDTEKTIQDGLKGFTTPNIYADVDFEGYQAPGPKVAVLGRNDENGDTPNTEDPPGKDDAPGKDGIPGKDDPSGKGESPGKDDPLDEGDSSGTGDTPETPPPSTSQPCSSTEGSASRPTAKPSKHARRRISYH